MTCLVVGSVFVVNLNPSLVVLHFVLDAPLLFAVIFSLLVVDLLFFVPISHISVVIFFVVACFVFVKILSICVLFCCPCLHIILCALSFCFFPVSCLAFLGLSIRCQAPGFTLCKQEDYFMISNTALW